MHYFPHSMFDVRCSMLDVLPHFQYKHRTSNELPHRMEEGWRVGVRAACRRLAHRCNLSVVPDCSRAKEGAGRCRAPYCQAVAFVSAAPVPAVSEDCAGMTPFRTRALWPGRGPTDSEPAETRSRCWAGPDAKAEQYPAIHPVRPYPTQRLS